MKEIIDIIRRASEKFGYETYVVGGFVRDQILGRESKDIDFLVNGPNAGIELSKKISEEMYKEDRTISFPRFGTSSLLINGVKAEFVSPRKEVYTEESRKPETSFATIDEDLKRRDFTINSIAIDLRNQEILDPLDGVKAINEKKIVCSDIEDPRRPFIDDPLRMMRAFKFASRFGFDIENRTMAAIRNMSFLLQKVSMERIQNEFNEILISDRPSKYIKQMMDSGIMVHIIPEIHLLKGLNQPSKFHSKDALGHTFKVLDSIKPDLVLRLAALLHDIAKPATFEESSDGIHFYCHEIIGSEMSKRILKRMKYPNKIINEVSFLVRNHMKINTFSDDSRTSRVEVMLLKFGEDSVRKLIELSRSDMTGHNESRLESAREKIQEFENRIEEIKNRKPKIKLPIDGNDIIKLGIERGPMVGKIKTELENQFRDNMTTGEAIEIVEKIIERMKSDEGRVGS